jgi:hypothetical protein
MEDILSLPTTELATLSGLACALFGLALHSLVRAATLLRA